jgi:hypothetical protein
MPFLTMEPRQPGIIGRIAVDARIILGNVLKGYKQTTSEIGDFQTFLVC